MAIEKIPSLTQSGIYLISRNQKVATSLNDFLVITLHSPSSSTTALILKNCGEHQTDFRIQLDAIYQKYSSLGDVDTNLIQSKIFGAGNKFTSFLVTLKAWLDQNQIPVVASDLGRAFPGELVLEGTTGRIRIEYQSQGGAEFGSVLSTGTARNRTDSKASTDQVLVVSSNPVIRTLAKQAIEEEPQWAASCPETLEKHSLNQFFKLNQWSAVIVSDEVKNESSVLEQVMGYAEAHPKVPMAWIGSELPGPKKEMGRFRLLPPLEPFLIPHFKKILKQTILSLAHPETSETLSFSKKKQAKS